MRTYRFTVPGRPVGFIRPEQSGRRRYSNPRYEDYKRHVQLRAVIAKVKPIPKTSSYHQDVDNVAKSIMDALQKIAYDDDDQVGSLEINRYDAKGYYLGNVRIKIDWHHAKKAKDQRIEVEISDLNEEFKEITI